MKSQFAISFPGLALVLAAGCTAVQTLPAGHPTGNVEVVHVALPTGEQAVDRASILAALDEVQPGGTVQFGPGTYLVGEMITVSIPQVTLLGHRQGTILRGCELDAYEEMSRDLGRASDWSGRWAAMSRCGILELTGGRATVRHLTFENTDRGLGLGCCLGEPAFRPSHGGYLIENNTFRNSRNGIRASLASADTTVIRRNQFINVYHAVSAAVSHFHVVDNDISVPEPEQVPGIPHPGFAIGLEPVPPGPGGTVTATINVCEHNVVAGNRIEGHPDGIVLFARPATSCRHNVIRDNTIAVRRVRLPASRPYAGPARITSEADSTVVGVPLALFNDPVSWVGDDSAPPGIFESNRIEGNRITGAEGLGIAVYRASRNRIVDNTIKGVTVRDPYPGNTIRGSRPEEWDEANGSGIWISPGSDENEIVGNEFEDVAAFAVVVEGDDNRVQLTDAAHAVCDLGTGNGVSGPDTTTFPPAYDSRFVDGGGVRLHYLDFGGEGLPIVFVHSEAWNAHTYAEFAPRFADRNRVLAITRPGYGDSEAHPEGFDVAAQAESLIDFLDALGIERAVFAGNSSPTVHLTYLAEHHPDRVAGVIYLAGLLTPWLREVRDSDPAGAGVMAARASAPGATARERLEALFAYRPEFLSGDRPRIEVPALAFAGRSGTIGHERFSEPLALVGSPLMADFFAALPPSPFRDHFQRLIEDPAFRSESLRAIEDPEAREFLLRLADDPELQAEVWRYQLETAGLAVLAGHDRFARAFGDPLRIVRLDLPVVYGYEYRDSPELIEPHIRRFLADLEPISVSSRDTIRHTVIVAGQPAGERLRWAESSDTWRYSARGPPSGFARTSGLTLDAEGLPVEMEISGRKNPMELWEERFHFHAGRATWSTPVDQGELSLSGPAYYAAIHPAHDLGILARALLRRSAGVLPLLPAGEARLELLERRVVEVDGRDRTIRLYAIHGLDLRPRYVWLDEDEATFADEWSVLAGWEAAYPGLRAAIGGAIAEHMRRMARSLAPPARERPLVIRGARLFDPETHAVHSGTTIIIEGNRILGVGPDATVDIPTDAEVVHAEGRMVLPGLWDMHAHQDPDRYFEWVGPVHLAAGVTTTRDMGSNADMLVLLRQRIDAGEVMGPRIIMAGFIEGIGGSRTGIQVENAAEAQAAVDRYAGLGFVQLKIYNQVPADLVPVAIERAKHHGMRVSGHIPWEMTGREAVESGYDEIQHMTVLMEGMVLDPDEDVTDSDIANALAGLTPESELVRDFIGLLASNDVAVDPTLAFFHSTGAVPPTWVADALDRLPPQARRRWLDRSAPLWAGERWSEILANQFGIVRALHETGVPILPGTDMMPGFGLHKELELYVEAGIPAPEVLTLATLGAARVMGMDDDLGSIEPGKLADLILVDGDPTRDIRDIRRVVTVVKDGRVYDPAAIYRALEIEPCCEP